jgi:NAD(P)-dependent dehydrogenase (short-subunit alcohol dehydrogenase family)
MSNGVLDGKVALVTGASTGIGREIARELARRGADLVINHFNDPEGAESAAAEIRELGRRAIALRADVGIAAEVEAMCTSAVRELGGIDLLVNNAGVQTWSPLLDLAEADWDRVIRTNLKGCFLCTQAAGRVMKRRGGGRVINIGSTANKLALPRLVDYTASRGGIEGFTKVAAVELAPFGITVNCVAPGATETERTKQESPDYAGTWAALTPLRRIGTPLDVARAVAFFAGPDAAFVTGQTLWVDGGLSTMPAWPYKL